MATAHQLTRPNGSEIIARSVLTGCATLLPAVEHEHYDFADWQEAADDAIETGDYARFNAMLAVEECHSDFVEWQHGGPSGDDYRHFTDFADWLASRTNCGDHYALAYAHVREVDRLRRERLQSAAARRAEAKYLAHLAKGHRAFVGRAA